MLNLKLIDDWRKAHKFASIQFAAFVAILSGILAANPGMVLGLIGMLPQGPFRIVAAIVVAIVVFVVPALTRVVQKKPNA